MSEQHYLDVFGESVTIAGAAKTAIWESGYLDALGVAGTSPALRCLTADVSAVTVGTAVVRAGTSYTVRNIQTIGPDEVWSMLVLERA